MTLDGTRQLLLALSSPFVGFVCNALGNAFSGCSAGRARKTRSPEAKAAIQPQGLRGPGFYSSRMCDDFVIGILSLHVPEQVWRDAVDMGERLATKPFKKVAYTPAGILIYNSHKREPNR
jgi:hypothetical protein